MMKCIKHLLPVALCLLLLLAVSQALASSTEVAATSIHVSPSSMMLTINGSDDLSVSVEPYNTTQTGVMFTSSDSTIASVSPTGVVTGHKEGTCFIYVQSVNPYVSMQYCTVTVLETTKITLDHSQLSLQTGHMAELNATVTPYQIANSGVTFSSSNNSVAVVSNTGGTSATVTAVGSGSATIYATAADGTMAYCYVTVGIPMTDISLSPSTVTINTGSTFALTLKVTPSNATNTSVTWSTSDYNVATVDNYGNVTTWCHGSAVITAAANDGSGLKASCVVYAVGVSVTHAPTPKPTATPGPTLEPGATPTPPVGGTAKNLATGSLNLRASASQNAKILARIPSGASMTVLEKGSKWCRVWYKGVYGYVMTSFISNATMPTLKPGTTATPAPTVTAAPGAPAGTTATVNTVTGSLNLRAAPSSGGQILRRIPQSAVITVVSWGDTWCKVWYNGTTGYAMTKFIKSAVSTTKGPTGTPVPATVVTPTPEPVSGSKARVVTTGGSLNLRSAATQSSTRVRLIPNGAVIDIITYGKEWCYASYQDSTGYVMTKYLKLGDGVNKSGKATKAPKATVPVSTLDTKYAQVNTLSGGLNLRKGPGTGYARVTIIPKNAYVTILQSGVTWTEVRYNTVTGYVMTAYLKKL